MRQIQVSRQHRKRAWRLDLHDPLPADPRDPDIVRAKELDRRRSRACAQRTRPAGHGTA